MLGKVKQLARNARFTVGALLTGDKYSTVVYETARLRGRYAVHLTNADQKTYLGREQTRIAVIEQIIELMPGEPTYEEICIIRRDPKITVVDVI